MKRDIAFSSGGWQGIVNDDFTEENVVRVAQAFVRYFFQSRRAPATFKVAVGYRWPKEFKRSCFSCRENISGEWY